MSLRVPPAPDEGLEIIRAELGSLLGRPESNTSGAFESTAPEQLTAAAPHQVYFVGLEDVAAGRLLSAATLTGWRYIILGGDRPLIAAQLDLGAGGERLEFSHTNAGPRVAGTLEGVSVAEALEEVKGGDFELRLLEVPGAFLAALWLHSEQKDLLLPLPPAPAGLEPQRPYAEQEVLAALRDLARQRMEMEDTMG